MHRTEVGNRQLNKFGAGKDGYQDPTPTPGDATNLTPDVCDSWQEEAARVVEQRASRTGLTLNTKTQDETDYGGYEQVGVSINRVSTDSLSFGTRAWCPETTPFGYTTGASLTQSAIPSVVVVNGRRVEISAELLTELGETTHLFTASKDTYVGLDPQGAAPPLSFTEVNNGDPAPALPAGEQWIAIVVTDALGVTSVKSLPYFRQSSRAADNTARDSYFRRMVLSNLDPLTLEQDGVDTPLEIIASNTIGLEISGTATNLARIMPDNAATTTRALLVDGPGAGLAADQDLVQIIPTGDGDGLVIDTSTTRRYGLRIPTFDDAILLAERAHINLTPYTQQLPSLPQAGDITALDVSGSDRMFWHDGTRYGRVHETPSGPLYDGQAIGTFTHTNPQTDEEVWAEHTVTVLEGDVVKFSFVGDLEALDGGINLGAPLRIRHRIRRSTNGAPIISGTLVYDFTHNHQSTGVNFTQMIRHPDLIYAVPNGVTSVTFGYTLELIAPNNNSVITKVFNGLVSAQFGQAAL